tara:strand:- start:27965 stop:28819 length:855 start_codon:yes stop_codon:yes gene_type:complete
MYEPNLNKTLFSIVSDVMRRGNDVEARGTKQKEITFYKCTIEDPTDLLIAYPDRKFNPDYAITEWLWYLSQHKSTENIGKMAKIWDMIKDENGECESNYGEYLIPSGQWSWVINELINDPDSRRATIAINQPYHKGKNVNDIPCTQYIQFFIRNGRLDMGVYMRSNDVIYGFCNDIFTFSLFHQLMCNDLKSLGLDVELGEYHHHAGSMHIYERHYDMANKIISNEASVHYKKQLPKIKLHSHVTLQYILSKELYLPRVPMTKQEIKEKSLELSKMLLEEVSNG